MITILRKRRTVEPLLSLGLIIAAISSLVLLSTVTDATAESPSYIGVSSCSYYSGSIQKACTRFCDDLHCDLKPKRAGCKAARSLLRIRGTATFACTKPISSCADAPPSAKRSCNQFCSTNSCLDVKPSKKCQLYKSQFKDITRSSVFPCQLPLGCDGIPGSGKTLDVCGSCGGDGKSCLGCDGVAKSGAVKDLCGVCGGNDSSCKGCDGVPNSGKVRDSCGVCGGDGSSCAPIVGMALFYLNDDKSLLAVYASCQNLGSSNEIIESRTAGKTAVTVKSPGQLQSLDVVCQHGLAPNDELESWRTQVFAGNNLSALPRDLKLSYIDANGSKIAQWQLKNAWPSALQIKPFTLDVLLANVDLNVVDEAVFSVEKTERSK